MNKSIINGSGMSRRDYLRMAGLAVGGLASVAATGKYGAGNRNPNNEPGNCYPTHYNTQHYSYFEQLPRFDVRTPLQTDEMRIYFIGSAIPPFGRAQRMMSIYVEVGWEEDTYENDSRNPLRPATPAFKPKDQVMFDCGPGVWANYISMNVPMHRMNKIFISHLHGDHMGELPAIYGLNSSGRMSPLYIFGQSASGVLNPGEDNPYSSEPHIYDDGIIPFCNLFRDCNRWQSEAFAFQSSSYASYRPPTKESWGLPHDPLPAGQYGDPVNDAFAIIPIELQWNMVGGVAYHNRDTGLKITHYPVIHCRQGSMGFKLVWTPPGGGKPLTMIYSSDTKPEWNSVYQAVHDGDGVDVFIHEMVVPPEVWSMKMQGLTSPDQISDPARDYAIAVQDSSHTCQAAFGYLLQQIRTRTRGSKLPRLTVATHFPTTDDTVACALKSVQAYIPDIGKVGDKLTWSYDCMVLRVFPDRIEQVRAEANDYATLPTPSYTFWDKLPPKYHTDSGDWNPLAQIDTTMAIPSTDDGGCNITDDYVREGDPTYNKSGY